MPAWKLLALKRYVFAELSVETISWLCKRNREASIQLRTVYFLSLRLLRVRICYQVHAERENDN